MFFYACIGFLLCKWNIISKTAKESLTNLVIYVALPSSIVSSFLVDINVDIIKNLSIVFLLSFAIQFACLALSYLIFRNYEKTSYSVLKYATICSNSGFMGTPLVQGIYGTQGLLYASVYLIAVRIFMWSVGLSCFCDTSYKEVIKKVITHPCIIAVVIGIFFMITQIQLPNFMLTSIDGISSSTTFLSMLVIGIILSEANFKHMISKLSLFYSGIRLCVIPITVFIVCYSLGFDPLVSAISCVLAGMPAGSTTAILASKYKGNEQLATQLVFVSTVFSLLTIPLLCMGIELIY